MPVRGPRSWVNPATAILVVAAMGLGAASPAAAAGGSAKAATIASAAAPKDPETTGSVQKASDVEPNCAQSRKRLWVEGEGWVVRRVTTCY